MAQTLVAVTNVKYGYIDENGDARSVWIDAGEFITDQLPEEGVEACLANGSIAAPVAAIAGGANATALVEALEARIAELEGDPAQSDGEDADDDDE